MIRNTPKKRTLSFLIAFALAFTSISTASLSLSVKAAVASEWSEWTEQEPEQLKTRRIEVKTQYRYRNKEVKELQSAAEMNDGYTLDRSVAATYGDWQDLGRSPVTASDTLEVSTYQDYDHSEYLMAHYCTGNVSGARYQTCATNNSNNATFNQKCVYHELGWFDHSLSGFTAADNNGYIYGTSKNDCYKCANTCYKWYRVSSKKVYATGYMARSIYHTYYKWSPWSDWEDKEYKPNSLREVETRKLYRYADYEGTINMCDATISEDTAVYTGEEVKPVPVVYDAEKKLLVEGEDYKLSYTDNINAGTAYVHIEGIGEHTGGQSLPFTITKATPTFAFEKENVLIKANAKAFENNLSTSADGMLTYSSEDESVATVSSNGIVTPWKMGSTTIHVEAAEGQNYVSGKASYTLTVTEPKLDPASLESLSFSFKNYGESIDEAAWFGMFGKTSLGKTLLLNHPRAGESGHCYGMASVSGMFNVFGSGISLDDFNKDKISDLKLKDISATLNMNLNLLIKTMFVSQYSSAVQRAYANNTDLNTACELAKEAQRDGQPVILGIFSGTGMGHALLGYKLEEISDMEARLYVYDCNSPNQNKYITVKKSGDKYTSWSYDMGKVYGAWSSTRGKLTYIPYALYQSFWTKRGFVTSLLKDTNTMFVNADSFDVRDYKNNVVASVRDGKLTYSKEDVFTYQSTDLLDDSAENEQDGTLLYLPTDVYQIENKDENIFELEVSSANVEQNSSVSTTADKVIISLDDEVNLNQVSVVSDKLDVYQVSMDNSNETGTISKAATVEGVAASSCSAEVGFIDGETSVKTWDIFTGSVVESSGTDDTDNNENNNASSGKESKNIEDIPVTLEYDSALYDGTAKEPAITLMDGTYKLKQDKDYIVKYINTKEVGTASLKVFGIGAYKGSLCKDYSIVKEKDGGTDEKEDGKPDTGNGNGYKPEKVPSAAPKPEIKVGTVAALKAVNQAKGVSLSWKKAENAEGYKIYRKNGKGAYKLLAAVSGKTTYVDKKTKAGKRYQYKIIAYKNSLVGKAGKTVKITRIEQPKRAVVKITKNGISVKWKKTVGAKDYIVLRKAKKGGWKKIGTTKKLTFVDKKAKKGQKYRYAVQAKNGKYVSGYLPSKAVKK